VSAFTLRQVETLDGPQDGSMIYVASTIELPETISFPVVGGEPRRHIYKRVSHTESHSVYRYDHMEADS
jgi:hypothetical protein